MKKVLPLVFLFCLLSCIKEKSETVVREFPITRELSWDETPVDSEVLMPMAMFCMNEYLIVNKSKDDFLFDMYDRSSLKHIKSFGRKGNGPEDFNSFNIQTFKTKNNCFSVLELGTGYLRKVEVKDSSLIHSREKLFSDNSMINGFAPINEKKSLIFSSIGEDHEFEIVSHTDTSEFHFGKYPEWIPEYFEPFEKFLTGMKGCVIHPSKDKIAVFYNRMKHFRLYDFKGVLIRDVSVQTLPFVDKIASCKPVDLASFYIYPQADDKYIYVLSNNKIPDNQESFLQELQVWDWNGKPVANFKLNKPISIWSFSSLDKKIYAMNKSESNIIYSLDLSSEL